MGNYGGYFYGILTRILWNPNTNPSNATIEFSNEERGGGMSKKMRLAYVRSRTRGMFGAAGTSKKMVGLPHLYIQMFYSYLVRAALL